MEIPQSEIKIIKTSETGKKYVKFYILLLCAFILCIITMFYFDCFAVHLTEDEGMSCGFALMAYAMLFLMSVPFMIGGGFLCYRLGRCREDKKQNNT